MTGENYFLFENIINNVDLEILEHAHFIGDSTWNFKNISSPYNRLYLVMDGEACLKNSFHKVTLRPGNMYLVPVNSVYDYICNDYIEKFYIHFRLDLFAGRDIFESLKQCIELPYDTQDTINLVNKSKSMNVKDILSCKLSIYHCIFSFLYFVTEDYSKHIITYIKYKDVFNYIKNNISAELKVQSVSEQVNIHPSSLARSFKKDLGISIKNYIDKMVVQIAKEKLVLTGLTVKQIAYFLRFNDEFYFSRFFKKHTGYSPKQYRLLNRMTPK
jgi:AraC-like DNA-binding protein